MITLVLRTESVSAKEEVNGEYQERILKMEALLSA